MVRYIAFLFAFIGLSAHAQDDGEGPYIHAGLIRAQATISVGALSDAEISPIYLHGNLEYYAEQNMSIRGDTYFYLNNLEKSDTIGYYHSNFFGIGWHPAKKGYLDPYVGLQPGVGLLHREVEETGREFTKLSPLVSANIGVNYYAPKWFHLFLDARYVSGMITDHAARFSLNELRFSFGLGFNIR